MTALPFPLRSKPAPFKFLGEARLINCYPEEIGQENKTPVAIVPLPGQVAFSSPADVASRGMLPVDEMNVLFSLHGSTLYSIASSGTATAISGIIAGSLPAVMERGPERYMQSEVTITIASPAVVSWTNHRLPVGTQIQFATTGNLPDNLDPATTYYVISAGMTANSFQVAATAGGSAINTTGDQAGTHTAIRGDATYQLVIVAEGAAYCVEDSNVYFVDLPETAISVTYLDGRWIYSCASGRSYYSELNDARTVDALSYFTAERRPDGMMRGFADNGELWLFGRVTTEIWTGSGDTDQPFVPLGGSFIDKGCGARDSVVSFDNAPHWVGHDNVVYRGSGYTAERVSSHSVERAIAAVADKTTIKGYTYTDRGHAFYVLTCDDWTWTFDAATREWHERKSYQRQDWQAWPYALAWGRHLVGDKSSGAINELSGTTYSEASSPIRVEMILPDIPGEMIFNRLEIDMATGVGLNVDATTLGYDPKLMLSWSDDGGNRWSSERVSAIGRQGDYAKTVAFTRLGKSKKKGRRFRIAMTDPVVKSFGLGDIQAEQVA